MSVIVPFVPGMLEERTREWAEHFGALLTELDPMQDDHYWYVLFHQWALVPYDMIVVEQDMLPADGVVEAMLGCRRPWCTSPYTVGTGTWLVDGLGCTKFSARLKTRHPDLMERVGELADGGQPAKTWRRLDTRISRVLHELGYRPHAHRRSTHLHDYSRRP